MTLNSNMHEYIKQVMAFIVEFCHVYVIHYQEQKTNAVR